jgi:hypothetical protein
VVDIVVVVAIVAHTINTLRQTQRNEKQRFHLSFSTENHKAKEVS